MCYSVFLVLKHMCQDRKCAIHMFRKSCFYDSFYQYINLFQNTVHTVIYIQGLWLISSYFLSDVFLIFNEYIISMGLDNGGNVSRSLVFMTELRRLGAMRTH